MTDRPSEPGLRQLLSDRELLDTVPASRGQDTAQRQGPADDEVRPPRALYLENADRTG